MAFGVLYLIRFSELINYEFYYLINLGFACIFNAIGASFFLKHPRRRYDAAGDADADGFDNAHVILFICFRVEDVFDNRDVAGYSIEAGGFKDNIPAP